MNQVVFSGDEDTTSQKNSEEKEGESKLWEKDRTAEDALSPELKNSADYLFQTGRTNLPDDAENINLAGDEANNSLLPEDSDNADLVNGTGGENSGMSGTGTGIGTGSGNGGSTPTVTPKPSEPSRTPAPQPATRPVDTVKKPETVLYVDTEDLIAWDNYVWMTTIPACRQGMTESYIIKTEHTCWESLIW